MVTVTISTTRPIPIARDFPLTITLEDGATIADLKATIANKTPRLYPERQKLTLKGEKKALLDSKRLLDVLEGQGELQVKDLGPQIGWRTTYLLEYIGPIVFHILGYLFAQKFYGGFEFSRLQKLFCVLNVLHYVKRELETLFVHRFSRGTMPVYFIFKNSLHYWIFGGLFLVLDLYRPAYGANTPYIAGTFRDDPTFLAYCTIVWALAELANLHTHLTLRNLRPANTTVRGIPRGILFSLVSCPNYFFEIIIWLTLCVMTGSYATVWFTIVGVVQIAIWAAKRHRNYKKEFGKEYPRGRKALIPFIW